MRSAIGWAMFFWATLALDPQGSRAADGHSHARPEHVRVRHVDLDLEVDFDRQRLRGQATLTVERTSQDDKQPLVLDSRKLQIATVETSADGKDFGVPGMPCPEPHKVAKQPGVSLPWPGEWFRYILYWSWEEGRACPTNYGGSSGIAT